MSGRYPLIKKCSIYGIKFASKAELSRYLVLKDMEDRRQILQLQVHPHFDFTVNGYKVGRGYTADFSYIVMKGSENDGHFVEDVKGPVERDWPLRKDLFLALYPSMTLLVNGVEVKRRPAGG